MNITSKAILLFSIILFFAMALPSHSRSAGDGIFLTEELQLKVADTFMEESEYYRAITEYKRFTIIFPGSEKTDYVLYKTGLAYYLGEEYESSIRVFSELQTKQAESMYVSGSLYFQGLAYWKLNRQESAALSFKGISENHEESDYAPLAIVAEALVALEKEDISGSIAALNVLIDEYPENFHAEQAKKAVLLLRQYGDLPRKSRALAAIMSAVLPGSGYIYAEHYGDGATSFFLNGLFIAGTITALGNASYALAGVTGVIGLPFYLGNIYGSANAAAKWNKGVKNELKNRIYRTMGFDTASPPVP